MLYSLVNVPVFYYSIWCASLRNHNGKKYILVLVFWLSAMNHFIITDLITIIVESLSADALFCTVLRQTAIVILQLASSGEMGVNTLLPLGFLKAMC